MNTRDCNDPSAPIWLELRSPDRRWLFELRSNEERAIAIGSESPAHVRIARPGVAPVHCYFEREDSGVCLVPAYGVDVRINAAKTSGPSTIRTQAVVEFSGTALEVLVHHELPEGERHALQRQEQQDTAVHAPSYLSSIRTESHPTRELRIQSSAEAVETSQMGVIPGAPVAEQKTETLPAMAFEPGSLPAQKTQVISIAPGNAPLPPQRTEVMPVPQPLPLPEQRTEVMAPLANPDEPLPEQQTARLPAAELAPGSDQLSLARAAADPAPPAPAATLPASAFETQQFGTPDLAQPLPAPIAALPTAGGEASPDADAPTDYAPPSGWRSTQAKPAPACALRASSPSTDDEQSPSSGPRVALAAAPTVVVNQDTTAFELEAPKKLPTRPQSAAPACAPGGRGQLVAIKKRSCSPSRHLAWLESLGVLAKTRPVPVIGGAVLGGLLLMFALLGISRVQGPEPSSKHTASTPSANAPVLPRATGAVEPRDQPDRADHVSSEPSPAPQSAQPT